jgi:hypothetical protein
VSPAPAAPADPHAQVAPFLSLLLNCVGWTPGFPRLLSTAQLGGALEIAARVGRGRLLSVGDISCDIEVRHSFSYLALPLMAHTGRPRVPHARVDAVRALLHVRSPATPTRVSS